VAVQFRSEARGARSGVGGHKCHVFHQPTPADGRKHNFHRATLQPEVKISSVSYSGLTEVTFLPSDF
jgi:hypothetical protein